jgi:hypothetical protein
MMLLNIALRFSWYSFRNKGLPISFQLLSKEVRCHIFVRPYDIKKSLRSTIAHQKCQGGISIAVMLHEAEYYLRGQWSLVVSVDCAVATAAKRSDYFAVNLTRIGIIYLILFPCTVLFSSFGK